MVPKWLEERYKTLWEAFGEHPFRMEEAVRKLSEKHRDPKEEVNVILSELRDVGLCKAELDPEDNRRRIYRLVDSKDIIAEMLSFNGRTLTRGDLESILKAAADLIRTRVDYTFLLVFLFYKRICDKWEMEFEEEYRRALEDGLSEEEAGEEAQRATYHDFDIPMELLWENIRKDPERLPEMFSRAMRVLGERNPGFRDIFENVDFTQFVRSRENAEILRQLVELFSKQSLRNVSPDILGDAYEWILRYFAPQKAKEGEVYTPREVIRLMVEMLAPKPGESVYDPACGSGGMLIGVYQYVEKLYGKKKADTLFLYGEEVNARTLALARMNLYIHEIKNARLEHGDTLLYPKFIESGKLQEFDLVIANPPWNQDGYDEDTLKKGEFWNERFRFGFPPRQSADWAWIQHMIASSRSRVSVVIDNGCLFRGGREGAIRREVVKSDLLDAVVLLPEKLFYNTGAPGAILIFSKSKEENRKGKVLFINASLEYEQHPEVKKLNRLGDEHIAKIAEAYREFKEGDGFSRVVSLEEIEKNDYNLNVTFYVASKTDEEPVDIAGTWEELCTIDEELKAVTAQVEDYLKELGYMGE